VKGRILVTIFALPFFGVGVWMLWSIGSTLTDAWHMRQWQPVEARLVDAGYETHTGDDSDSYEAYAIYNYSYSGREYRGTRVAVAHGADNVGDYQRDLGNRLAAQLARGQSITVWVDPQAPGDAVVDRTIRWGLIGFKSIFVVVFGGPGLGFLIYTWMAAKPKDATLAQFRDAPWLSNDAWQTPSVRSGSKSAMWGAWIFAVLWNAISAVTPFIAWREVVDNDNYIALVALLFPLVGMWLLVWAIRRTLEWRRFGPAPVTLDPFPGAIGGHVGGTIDLRLPYDSTATFRVTLTCVHSYMSGSGKNRSRSETAEWQDELVAHAEPGGHGTRLAFRFDVPEALEPADASRAGDSYYLWRLNLRAGLPGADVDRDYDIPVYATGELSRHLSDRTAHDARDAQDAWADARVRQLVQVRNEPMGKSLLFPMGRHLGASLAGILFGAVFAAAGWFLVVHEGHTVFGVIFGGVGALIGLTAFYMATNSLEISQDGVSVHAVSRWLGVPIRRKSMRRVDFRHFGKKSSLRSQSGGRHRIYYGIDMVDHSGNRMRVGEGFQGESEARAAMRFLAGELGLRHEEPRPDAAGRRFGADVLLGDA